MPPKSNVAPTASAPTSLVVSDAFDAMAPGARDEAIAAANKEDALRDLEDESALAEALGEALPDEPELEPEAPDPVALCADAMLAAAVAANPALIERGRATGAVAVLTAPAGWERPVAFAWCRLVGLPTPDGEGDSQRYSSYRNRIRGPLVLCGDLDKERFHRRGAVGEDVRRALREGRGIIMVLAAADPDASGAHALLRAATDAEGAVPTPSAAMLRTVAEAVGTGSAPPIADDVAAEALPDHAAMAARPGQTALDYLRRLERLVVGVRPAAVPASQARWTLDNLPLQPDVLEFGRALVADLDAYRAGTLPWADVLGRGALLYGPPGTGKTTFAKALAASCGPDVLLVVGGYSVWESGEDGKGSYGNIIKCMRQSFQRAKAAKAAILFIDEIDSFMARGKAGHNESWFRPIINALLAELDGITGREGVVIIGCTNLVDEIDPALRRSGRLDVELRMSPPNAPTLARILAAHLPGLSASDLSDAALRALGASGADCERWGRGARRRARTAGRPVEVDDLLAEFGEGEARTDEYQRRIALHESGHAVASTVLRPGSVKHASTRPGGGAVAGGVTTTIPTGVSVTRVGLESYIVEALAGRAAEEIMLGNVTGGSVGDLATATRIAAMLEVSYGLGAQLLSFGDIGPDDVTKVLIGRPDLAARVEETLQSAYSDALALVRRHRPAVEAVAQRLLARQTLGGDEVSAIVASARPTAARAVGRRVPPVDFGGSPGAVR